MRGTFVGSLLIAAILLFASRLPAKPGVVVNLQGQSFGGAAIDKMNLTAKPKIKLGPSAAFNDDLTLIKQCKAEVGSGTIPVTTEGGVPNVDVLINGKCTERMTWDSGCSGVTLSAKAAKELGLHASDSDPIEEQILADGSHVKVHVLMLDSIRIGPYTVDNVRCTLPARGGEGADLLGVAFQSCFEFKLDLNNQTLQLTPLSIAPGKKKKTGVAGPDGQTTVDLLDGISVADQTVQGRWQNRGGTLYSDLGEYTRIDFNYQPPVEYDYQVTFTRLEGHDGIDIFLCGSGRQFALTFGGWNNTVCGFGEICGKGANENPTTVKGSLENGRTYNCLIKVRSGQVSAYLDGQLLTEWKTDFRDLGREISLHRADTLGLSTFKSSYAVSAAEVVEISGPGAQVAASDPVNAKVMATATYVTPGKTYTVKLYDNGHFQSPDDPDHRWFLKDNQIVFRWGRWVDRCVLSTDGRTFSGRNLTNEPISGELLSGSFTPDKAPAVTAEQHLLPAAVVRSGDHPPPGLVLYLPFDKTDAIGDIAHDHSSARLALPMHNVDTHTESVTATHGTADFSDGSFIDLKSFGPFPTTTSFTIALWVKAPDQRDGPLINNSDSGGARRGFSLRISDSKPHFTISDGDWCDLAGSTRLTPDTWHHLAATCDAGMIRLYVDGVEDVSQRMQGKFAQAKYPLEIGRNPYKTSRQFVGSLAEVMLCNRAMPAEEIAKLAGIKK